MTEYPPLESEYAEIARRLREAGDEIDRLRAALRNIRDIVTTEDDWPADSVVGEVRAALGESEG